MFDADSSSGYPSAASGVALAQEHRALRRRLAEVEAGVERDLLGCEAGGLGPRGTVEQERGDVADEVVVVRVGIGDARLQADVGGDDRRAVRRRDARGSRGRRSR